MLKIKNKVENSALFAKWFVSWKTSEEKHILDNNLAIVRKQKMTAKF